MRNFQHGMVNPAHFAMQPRPGVPRSAMDVRHTHKTTFGAGQLIPFYIREVLPGDSFRVHMQALVRLAPMIVPVMDNLCLHTWFFFVPNRLSWTNWEKFMGESDDPTVTPTQYLIPQVTDIGNVATRVGKLADYFGITNNQSGNNVSVNALPFRGYNLIWNYWFRDTGIIPAANTPLTDGPDSIASYPLQAIQKAKDYFTTARTYPAGSPEFVNGNTGWVGETGFTQAPLNPGGRFTFGRRGFGVRAPLYGLGVEQAVAPSAGPTTFNESGGRSVSYDNFYGTASKQLIAQANPAGNFPDIGILVSDMRTAAMIQRYLEADQRGGTNYAVKNWFHFGVRSPDSRLQNPEFLGGGRTMVSVNPVAQTSANANQAGGNFAVSSVMASLAATGYAAASGHGFSYSFVEHGYVIGVLAVRGDLTYQQGIDRLWKRKTPFDFYTPETAGLSEQAIMSSEIWSDGTASDNNVFGYQERWAEYRNAISRTSGFMRSIAVDSAGVASTIDMWHFGQKFTARPTLNGVFLIEDPAVSRSLQSSAPYAATFFGDLLISERMVRPMPVFSIPGVGGRL